jgi:hypothetical protein
MDKDNLSISARLEMLGLGHHRTVRTDATQAHAITDLATGAVITEMTAHEAVHLLNLMEEYGAKYRSSGAPDFIIAYPCANGVLGDFHGNPIGTWRAVSTWRTPRSFYSGTMSQIEAVVNGVRYTGRGAGEGMVYKGKRKAA